MNSRSKKVKEPESKGITIQRKDGGRAKLRKIENEQNKKVKEVNEKEKRGINGTKADEKVKKKTSRTVEKKVINPKKEDNKNDSKKMPGKKEPKQEYEEDFEEYESDFEEEENDRKEKQEEEEAKNEDENKQLSMGTTTRTTEEEESLLLKRLTSSMEMKKEMSQQPTEMDGETTIFVTEQREFGIVEVGSESERRKKDQIREKEEQEGVSPWMVEYFKELAGQSENRKQAWTQTDGIWARLSIGIQTEMAGTHSKGVQWGWAIDNEDEGELQQQQPNDEGNQIAGISKHTNLPTFLHDSGQLMIALLNSSLSPHTLSSSEMPYRMNNISNLSFSSRYCSFSLNKYFKENRFCAIALKNPHTICLCIFISNSNDFTQNRKSFAAEFSLLEDSKSQPERFMCCNHEVAFLRYSPDSSALFAALKDGSLIAWNLHKRGTSTQLNGNSQFKENILMPAINTAFIHFTEQSEKWDSDAVNWADYGIVGMEVLDGGGGRAIAKLVVLHESGLIRCWTALDNSTIQRSGVIGKTKSTNITEEESIRLIQNSSANCLLGHLNNPKEFEMATCLALHNWSGQSGTFLGTTKGRILRINLINGDRGNISSDYILDQENSMEVTSLKFRNECFAASTTNQKIFIFNIARSEPLRMLLSPLNRRLPSPLLLELSPKDTNILYSIHAGEDIVIWNLENNREEKMRKEICKFHREYLAKIQSGLTWIDQSGNVLMAFGLSNGEVQIHHLK